MIIASGEFVGRSGHTLTGKFEVRRQDSRLELATSDDFFFDGSPEPAWSLSATIPTSTAVVSQENIVSRVRFGDLARGPSVTGPQRAQLPDDIELIGFQSIILWCFRFPTLLGVGQLRFNEQNLSESTQ